MRYEALASEVKALPADARRKLVALQDESREGYAARLATKIDDKSSERWLTPEQCEHKLGLSGESK